MLVEETERVTDLMRDYAHTVAAGYVDRDLLRAVIIMKYHAY